MGFMKHFRLTSKSKNKHKEKSASKGSITAAVYNYPPVRPGADFTKNLPEDVLRLIFTYVCPHVEDFSYESCEDSQGDGDGCMSCDLRDLANCTKVRRDWYPVASGLLYTSIRIDAVHYCELEEILTEKRRRRSRHEPIDPPAVRLQLLSRTVRENAHMGNAVRYLRVPYMTRETCKADLARTVSVLPNLRYVDLPDGVFNGDSSCLTLRQELQARCPDLRKMKYMAGAEQFFESLLQRHWQRLEAIDLRELRVEPNVLRRVLAALPDLRELKIVNLPWVNDTVFQQSVALPPFPPLQKLTLLDTPAVTANGLATYLDDPAVAATLTELSLESTGVKVADLWQITCAATHLKELRIVQQVSMSLPPDELQALTSTSLRKLVFEITSSPDNHQSLHPPAASYYSYLSSSLLSNSLPALRELYVCDPNFPETLALAPPVPSFAADAGRDKGATFSQPLEVYSKGEDELEWVFTSVTPSDVPGRRGSMMGGRPLSSYSAHKGLGPQWGGDARRSIIVGNGFGGFLAIPADEPVERRPGSSHSFSGFPSPTRSERRASRADLWR